jgi:hypothetical protein
VAPDVIGDLVMTNAITLVSTLQTDGTAFATANTTATLVPSTIGNCMFVVTRCKSQTVGIASMSGGGCAVWDHVGTFSFASGGGSAETIDFWVGVVTTTGSQTLTLTGTASLAAISLTTVWQQFTVSGVAANTSWVAELAASLSNVASTNITYPTLTPNGPNRLYLGFAEPNGAPNTTGATAGYTAQKDANASTADQGQLITNPTLTSGVAAAPVGTQGTSATSIACAVLLRATNPDTTVGTTLNIGSGSGQNHFKLQTAFSNYAAIDEYTQAQIAGGWNTDPQFVATANGTVQFSVAADAPTTDGSTFARSELREMATDGVTNYAFNALSGVHWLRGRIKVTAMPGADSSPPRVRTTLCQMHDGGTIGEMIKFYVQDNSGQSYRPELRLSVWDSGTGMPKYVLNFAVQDQFDYMLKIDNTISAGWWGVYYQDLGTPVYTSLDYIADGFTNVFTGATEYYFKTGSYPTVNETTTVDPAALSTVELSYLQHWHTGWPTPSPAITLPKTFQFAPSFG